MFTGDTFTDTLLIAAMIASGVVTVTGIGIFVMWIKYSWIEKTNTMGYTGGSLTQKLFSENGLNLEIQSSYFYAKYWNHNKRRNTYKLRPWTVNRSSIWTMMEASQQAYATIIRETKPSIFWTAFRLPRFISWAGGVIGIGIVSWGIYAAHDAGRIDNPNFDEWLRIWVGFSVVVATTAWALVYKTLILRKEVPKLLSSSGLLEFELEAIRKIYNWFAVYAIANAILQSIRLLLEILEQTSRKIK